MRLLLTLLVGLLVHAEGLAHHSASIYDREAPVSIEGAIVRYDWTNPHVYLYVEQETGPGERVTWEIEANPPAILRRLGWTEDTVKVGDRVTITGIAGRDLSKKIALMQTLEKTDATVLSMQEEHLLAALAAGDAAVPQQATSLDGTWVTLLDLAVVGPFIAASGLGLTEKGQTAVDSFVEATDSPAIQCIPSTAPLTMLTPDIKSIEVRPDVVLIRSEFDTSERTVYLDLESHDGAAESIQGHSIGRWDSGALVIDTTRFAPHRTGIAGRLTSGHEKHLVERLALNAERSRLTYGFELQDPEYLTAPIKGEIQWSYRPDLQYTALPCDLDNARRFTE
jgi:hypothetical protein